MRLFDPVQAKHFCAPIPLHVPGQIQSLKALHQGLKATLLNEGTPTFEIHRVSLLTSVERWLLFGIGHYRRALDMFIPGAAPWMHVTLYYSSYFSANAILGMFGGWADSVAIVDVERTVPGQQALRIRRRPKAGPTGLQGSHKMFWDYYYEGCNSLIPWVPSKLQDAVSPVNTDRSWQITARNDVNYDTVSAHDAAIRFKATFNPQRLQASLAGALRQQFDITEKILKLAVHFANELKLKTFGLQDFNIPGQRGNVFRRLVTQTPPSVVQQSVLQHLLT